MNKMMNRVVSFLGGYRASAAFLGYVALAVVVVAIGFRSENIREIVSKSCTTNPNSAECIRSLRSIDRNRSVRDSCIQIRRVGYACPAPTRSPKSGFERELGTAPLFESTPPPLVPALPAPSPSKDPPSTKKPPTRRTPQAPPAAPTLPAAPPPASPAPSSPGQGLQPPAAPRAEVGLCIDIAGVKVGC